MPPAAVYLTCEQLQARLRAQDLALGGRREQLLARCQQHGLVTEYERLAQRSGTASRRAWLEHELRAVGCVPRDDSRLCAAYLRGGEGDPRRVAEVMAEMKFFHEHTEYEAIRDALYEQARDEYQQEWDEYRGDHDLIGGGCFGDRPGPFGRYYDKDEASHGAKGTALRRWTDAQASLEAALHAPVLPRTLRRAILLRICESRLDRWARSRRWERCGSVHSVARDASRAAGSFIDAHVGSSLDDADLTTGAFEQHLAGALQGAIDVRQREKRVEDAVLGLMIPPWMTLPCIHGDSLVIAARRTLRRVFRAFGAPLGDVGAALTIEATRGAIASCRASSNGVQYAEEVARLFVLAGAPSARDVQRTQELQAHTWACHDCGYRGSGEGVLTHSRNKHGALHARDVRASRPGAVIDAALFDRTVVEGVCHRVRTANAARAIQRHWRHAIACPDHTMCRRRLLREAVDLGV